MTADPFLDPPADRRGCLLVLARVAAGWLAAHLVFIAVGRAIR